MSPTDSLVCPLCRDPLSDLTRHRCTACETEYHRVCLMELGGCSTLGCELRGARIPEATVSSTEEARAPAPETEEQREPQAVCHGCGEPLRRPLPRRCPGCAFEYHRRCWNRHGCVSEGCTHARAWEDKAFEHYTNLRGAGISEDVISKLKRARRINLRKLSELSAEDIARLGRISAEDARKIVEFRGDRRLDSAHTRRLDPRYEYVQQGCGDTTWAVVILAIIIALAIWFA